MAAIPNKSTMKWTTDSSASLLAVLLLVIPVFVVQAFVLPPVIPAAVNSHGKQPQTPAPSFSSSSTRLKAGDGVATNYTWHEEALEIEVSVRVPKHTRAKDVRFEATSRSVDLRLRSASSDDDATTVLLLDGDRPTRGRINLDGTYWVLSDAENDSAGHRIVTVTIEKLHRTPADDFEVMEYDWKGVYADEYDDEVILRRYDEPEPFDVREYAAKMGVDVDNINMSMVDKTMFSSGLNMTQSSLDEMKQSGLLQDEEVTQQRDGREFTVDEEEGRPQAFTPYGKAVHPDEMATTTSSSSSSSSSSIPFLDTSSPWHQAVPVENVTSDKEKEEFATYQRNLTRAAFAADAAQGGGGDSTAAAKDPIDTLTVARLKEILKSQGLPVSGNKAVLQQRLRSQVNSLLQGKQQQQQQQQQPQSSE